MFETISMAPPDPILGLTEAFRKDSNPDKINLSVGVYKDSQGNTPLLLACLRGHREVRARGNWMDKASFRF